MGSLKFLSPSAQLRIGKTDTGRYKVYVVGPTTLSDDPHWIEAGGGAWRKNAPIRLKKQPARGFAHPREALEWAEGVFSQKSVLDNLLSHAMGSESMNIFKASPPPVCDDSPIEPWNLSK